MHWRGWLKYLLHGKCPLLRGSFRYFGVRVWFPANSHLFWEACKQGTYEAHNVNIMCAVAKPQTLLFDVGANIGLMAIPVLQAQPQCRVVSIEPSPNSIRYLRRTAAESGFGARWQVIEKVAGEEEGTVRYFVAAEARGAFDGMADTGRAGTMRAVSLPATTLDRIWTELGTPPVALIKIDVEGAELQVLRGARECLRRTRPIVLLEWSKRNLPAFGVAGADLLAFAAAAGFEVQSVPALTRIADAAALELHMALTNDFLLIPK